MHGLVHGCMVVGGFINDVLYYLGLMGGRIDEVGPEDWWSPGL